MKQKKLLVLVGSMCLVLVLALLPFMGACAKPAPAPAPAPAPIPAPAPAEPTKVWEFRFAHHLPTVSTTHKSIEAWANKVEEQTQGRVKITIYPAQSLVQSGDQYEAISGGICDIAFTAINTEPDTWPLNLIFVQPAVGAPLDMRNIDFCNELLNKFPGLMEEMDNANIKVLWRYPGPPETNIHTTGKAIRVPDDIPGLKIIAIGYFVEYLRAAGGSPLSIMPPEMYMALERGLAEGVMIPYYVMDIIGCTELLPYHLSLDLAAPQFIVIMNRDKWNSLPLDIQKIMDDCSEWVVPELINAGFRNTERVLQKCQDLGHTTIEPTPEEYKLWKDGGIPMIEEWIERTGEPARTVFEEAVRLAKKHSQ